jgi:anti-anti-sigma factor
MKIDLYRLDQQVCLIAAGRLILEECEAFRSIAEAQLSAENKTLFIGLTGVDYLDSAGLGALVEIKVKAQQHQVRFSLLDPSPGVANILNISKLSEIFEIITGLDAAKLIDDMAKPGQLINSIDTLEHIESSLIGSPSWQPATPGAPLSSAESALEDITAIPKRMTNRESAEWHCRQAVESLRNGDLEKSAELYQKATELDPVYIPARNNLAIVYEKKPEWRELAIEQWQKLLELSQLADDEKHLARASKHLAILKAR